MRQKVVAKTKMAWSRRLRNRVSMVGSHRQYGRSRGKTGVIAALLILAAVIGGLLHLIGLDAETPQQARRAHGIARMTTGLIGLWIILGGGLMYVWRDQIAGLVRRVPLDERVKFTLFAVLLACLEEVVTVSMTNLAPVFGASMDEAHITASANYLDVIAFHSVVVFVPFFIVLPVLLARWAFSPFAVFLSFGVVGTVCEAIFAGNLGAVIGFPIWVFVYGLMVWLPAYCMQRPHARPVGWVGNMALAPAVFLLALPLVALEAWVITGLLGHPRMHFGVGES